MSVLPDLFPGFGERRIATPGGEIYLRTGGSGAPLLLLHGYPQTHVCWHQVAPNLARYCALVIGLRGYGQSSAPPRDQEHAPYFKRAMAQDCVAVMRALGYRHFAVTGHDRGVRVGYRLALDHPDKVSALIVLDILPPAEVWRRFTAEGAIASYHWTFLAQPNPLPETLIAADPIYYVEHTLKSWAKLRNLSPFSAAALTHYRALMQAPDCVHAVCEDYRAGATIDRRLDETDLAAGRRIACPTFLLWGRDYLGRTGATRLRSGAALGQRRAGRRNYIWSFSRRGEPEGQLCCAGRLPHRTNHYSLEDAENK
jgi:haloacetate dehalogenase